MGWCHLEISDDTLVGFLVKKLLVFQTYMLMDKCIEHPQKEIFIGHRTLQPLLKMPEVKLYYRPVSRLFRFSLSSGLGQGRKRYPVGRILGQFVLAIEKNDFQVPVVQYAIEDLMIVTRHEIKTGGFLFFGELAVIEIIPESQRSFVSITQSRYSSLVEPVPADLIGLNSSLSQKMSLWEVSKSPSRVEPVRGLATRTNRVSAMF